MRSKDGTPSSSKTSRPCIRSQLRAFSISFALSSADPLPVLEKRSSNFEKAELPSVSALPPERIQSRAFVISRARSSSDLRVILSIEDKASKEGKSRSSSTSRPWLRIQFNAFSISFARSSADCPAFLGRTRSSFLNFEFSSTSSSAPIPDPFRSQLRASDISFARSSSERALTLPNVSKLKSGASSSPNSAPLLRNQPRALAMASAFFSSAVLTRTPAIPAAAKGSSSVSSREFGSLFLSQSRAVAIS